MADTLRAIKSRRTVRRGRLTTLKKQFEEMSAQDLQCINLSHLQNLRGQMEKDIQIHADLQTRFEDLILEKDDSESQQASTEEVKSGAEHQIDYEEMLSSADALLENFNIYKDGVRLQTSFEEWVNVANPEAKTFLKESRDFIGKIEDFLKKSDDHPGDVIRECRQQLKPLISRIHTMVHTVKEPTPVARKDSAPAPAMEYRGKFDIELPHFHGSPMSWAHFHKLFTVTMEKRGKHLSSEEKCCLLLNALKDPKAKELAHMNSAGDNGYTRAMDVLIQRYGQPRVVLPMLIRTLKENRTFSFSRSSLLQIGNHHCVTYQSAKALDTTLSEVWAAYVASQFDRQLADEWGKHTTTLSNLPTMEDLEGWINSLICNLADDEQDSSPTSYTATPSSSSSSSKPRSSLQVKTESKPRPSKCTLCNEASHSFTRCSVFKDYTPDKRWKVVKDGRYCTNCLHHSHTHQHCPSTFTCRFCNGKHHSLLHKGDTSSTNPTPSVPSMVNTISEVTSVAPTEKTQEPRPPVHSFLNTALVNAVNQGRSRHSRVALDSGSSTSLITEALASQLKLKRHSQRLVLEGAYAGGTSKHFVQVTLHSLHETQQSITLKLSVISKLPYSTPPRRAFDIASDSNIKDLPLADSEFGGRLDILLGSLDVCKCMRGNFQYFPDPDIAVSPTIFGWTVTGPLDVGQKAKFLSIQTSPDNLSASLQRLWELEQVPNTSTHTSTEADALQQFEDNKSTDSSGRYKVSLPKINSPPELGKSKPMALSRFFQNERSLKRKSQLLPFAESLLEYATLDHAEVIPAAELDKPAYYLPVHGVFKAQSTTTKVRPVFDASAKSDNGVSLNDLLLPGPNLYPLLTDILIQFRQHQIGISADISKMFREILLNEEERDLHRFLMRNADGELKDYRMKRLTFGVKSSPFLATKVLHDLAERHSSSHPTASHAILNHFYVDDFLSGARNLEEAKLIREELCELLNLAGMTLRKWRTSSQEFARSIPEHLRETEILTVTEAPKALGLHWDTVTDSFKVATPETPSSPKITKRLIASLAAQVYDILGFFAPFVIRSKLLLQQLWKIGTDWDEEVPESIRDLWKDWVNELPSIHDHPISRRYNNKTITPVHQSLHGFSDASTLAYGAVIYLRQQFPEGSITSSLVISKARVAPVKTITIPRAELVAAHLLAKLLSYTANLLQIPISQVHAWTDSTIVLCWLRKPPSTLQTFVANRIGYIQSTLPEVTWRHVPTLDNPADLLSRGVSASTLTESSLWWVGPVWLTQTPDQWTPQEHLVKALPRSLPEQKAVVLSLIAKDTPINKPLWKRFSSFHKLTRVIAWMKRFTKNSRHKELRISSKQLTSQETQECKTLLLKMAQKESFPEVFKLLKTKKTIHKAHQLAGLNLEISQTGLITATGRVRHGCSRLPKVVVVLNLKAQLTRLLIATLHQHYQHPGIAALMAIVSEDFYVPNLRSHLKKVSRSCAICQKAYARTSRPPTGLLPSNRTNPAPPFSTTGLDFAGPVIVRQGYTRKPVNIKTYVCIFVCFATKAIHIELCSDLTTEAFMAALKRFCARRGTPAHIHSDNGTNFVGAAAELRETQTLLKSSKDIIANYCNTANIEWHFIPPRAPNFGGLWEAGVKQMKTLLRKQVSQHPLKFEELTTVLTEVEAILNSRPITPLDSTEVDDLALTPGHFLIGRPLKTPARPCSQTTKIHSLKRWALVQRLQQDLWLEWQGWYKHTLIRGRKNQTASPKIQVGDVVLLKDEAFTSTQQWPMARVTELYPGDDGIPRAADILCQGRTYRRAIGRLIPLFTKDNEVQDLQSHNDSGITQHTQATTTKP